MTSYRFAFFVSNKPRAQSLALSVAKGAKRHGDLVELIPQDQPPARVFDYDGGMIVGIARYSTALRNLCQRMNRHYVVFDKGYLNRVYYYRFAVDAWQPLAYMQRKTRSAERFHKLNWDVDAVTLGPRRPGSSILLASCCQSHNNYHGVGNLVEYNTALVAKIKQHTDRPIIYRPNPGWMKNHPEDCQPIPGTTYSSGAVPFRQAIRDAHLVITHGSSAAFSAIMRGTPAMTLGECIARPLSLTESCWDRIEDPYWAPDDERRQFVYDATYCQWMEREFESGQAWVEMRDVLAHIRGKA